MSEKLLEIKDLRVIYKTAEETVHAVNGMELVVNKGETLGLVGETGAGKTTMALSVLRLLPFKIGKITEGQVLFEGEDILKLSDKQMRQVRGAKISMIFQDPMTSLNPSMTIGKQIAENLKLHFDNLSRQELNQRVDDILGLVGINVDRRDSLPHELSGGMKQRIVIAIAMACEPKLILADEPTTALDVTIQAQVLDMMRELKSRLDTAMVLITHDLGLVAENCDRVAIMYAGEIIEQGGVEEIFSSQRHHPYTMGLFGSIPDLTRKTKRLRPIDGMMPDPTNLPPGCPFAPRCHSRMDICDTQNPKPACNGNHMVRCHLYDTH